MCSGLHFQVGHVADRDSRLSFGTGRPAILREDESVLEAREFLKHRMFHMMHIDKTQLTPCLSSSDD